MLAGKNISLGELEKYGSVLNLNEQAKTLVLQQQAVWEIAKKNFGALKKLQSRIFDFGHFKIITQFNPERIRSSAAKTDTKSIAARPCFLCLKNLPGEQRGLIFDDNYIILANPYPIFPVHLTISHKIHTPQLIKSFFGDMLKLSSVLPDFTVFYNGSKTGASAPDHFHFQAAINGIMPFETEFANLKKYHSKTLLQTDKIEIIAVEDYLRPFFAFISSDAQTIACYFNDFLHKINTGPEVEPLMNILCTYKNGMWQVLVFPRSKQRPSHFFKTGSEQIVTGPASVELGGILILPREEDFKKICKKQVEEIYREVVMDLETFRKITFEK